MLKPTNNKPIFPKILLIATVLFAITASGCQKEAENLPPLEKEEEIAAAITLLEEIAPAYENKGFTVDCETIHISNWDDERNYFFTVSGTAKGKNINWVFWLSDGELLTRFDEGIHPSGEFAVGLADRWYGLMDEGLSAEMGEPLHFETEFWDEGISEWRTYEFSDMTISGFYNVENETFYAYQITWRSDDYETWRGVGVGDSLAELLRRYPELLPWDMGEKGQWDYYQFSPTQAGYSIVFAVEEERVAEISLVHVFN